MKLLTALAVVTLMVLALNVGVQAYQRTVLLEDYTSST